MTSPLSTPEQRRQQAEAIVADTAHCDAVDRCGHCSDQVAVIERALSAAYQQGQISALEAAAREIQCDRWMNWWARPIHEEVRIWLQDRADDIENQAAYMESEGK